MPADVILNLCQTEEMEKDTFRASNTPMTHRICRSGPDCLVWDQILLLLTLATPSRIVDFHNSKNFVVELTTGIFQQYRGRLLVKPIWENSFVV